MVYLIGLILFAVAVWFVAYPLFRPTDPEDEAGGGDLGEDIGSAGSCPIAEELELDREMGNISEDAYRMLTMDCRNRSGSDEEMGDSACG